MMRRDCRRTLLPALLFGLVASGCEGPSAETEPPGPIGRTLQVVGAEATPADSVIVVIPAEDYEAADAACERPRRQDDLTLLALRWERDGDLRRRISARFDQTGAPQRYSDMRGAVLNVGTMGTATPGTMILVDFERSLTLVQNQGDAGTHGQRVPLGEALAAETLDAPARWIRRLWRECRE